MNLFKNPLFRILFGIFMIAILSTLFFVMQFVSLGDGDLNAAAKAMYLFFAVISGSWALLMLGVFGIIKYMEKRLKIMMTETQQFKNVYEIRDGE